MSKGLKALKEFKEHYFFEQDEEENLNAIEKELKALEIIKEKKVSVDYLMFYIRFDKEKALDSYNQWTMEYGGICLLLTQEEYDLLKEVL